MQTFPCSQENNTEQGATTETAVEAVNATPAIAGRSATFPTLALNGQIANPVVHSGVGFNHQANNNSVFANALVDPSLTMVGGLQNHIISPMFPVSNSVL